MNKWDELEREVLFLYDNNKVKMVKYKDKTDDRAYIKTLGYELCLKQVLNLIDTYRGEE